MVGGLLSSYGSWLLGGTDLNAAPNSAVKRLNFDEVDDSDLDSVQPHINSADCTAMAGTKKKPPARKSNTPKGLVASTKKPSNQRKGKKKVLPPVTQQSDTEPSDSEPSDKEDEEEDIVDAGVSDEEQDDPQDPEEDNGFDYDDDEDDEEDVDSLTATATPRCNVTTPRVSTIQALQTP
jgi:cobalamin biosynthesis protein CobT